MISKTKVRVLVHTTQVITGQSSPKGVFIGFEAKINVTNPIQDIDDIKPKIEKKLAEMGLHDEFTILSVGVIIGDEIKLS